MLLEDFNFDLPEDLIAQSPAESRSASRLFVLRKDTGEFIHDQFSNITAYLRPDDLLVFNNAKVIPARIYFLRESGARIEFLLSSKLDERRWLAVCNKMKKLKSGEILSSEADRSVQIRILGRQADHMEIETLVEFTDDVLNRVGQIPLPPYIQRDPNSEDSTRYQTVYASEPGAVAAPTAGLHFTDEILSQIRAKGCSTLFLTLDVSWGTFSPVRSETVAGHVMHSERYTLLPEVAEQINSARRSGRRIIAVGTTSLRVLESTFDGTQNNAGSGETSIFIYPPMQVKSADCLITNFHTPKSTLLMLVSAFAGYDLIKKAYREAVDMKYRFFSYGDSMFIEGR